MIVHKLPDAYNGIMEKATYNIDISAEFGDPEILAEFQKYDIEILEYVKYGLGGGNPNYVVFATPENFKTWSLINYSDDPESYRVF
jgi:hypothetical protein